MSTTTIITERPSPWWYRMRTQVMLAIYALGFWGGAEIWGLSQHTPTPFFIWAGHALGPMGASLVLAFAMALTLACWAVRVWGSSYLRADVVWNKNAVLGGLVVDGPFRYVRNPLYFGNLLLAIAIGMLATPCGFGIIAVGNLLFLIALGTYESEGLSEQYGEAFTAYARAVPSLAPRLTPANVSGGASVTPSLKQGLRAEILTAAIVVGMITLMILQQRGIVPLLVIWIVGWIIQQFSVRPSAP